jgi:predicted amidohydrolase
VIVAGIQLDIAWEDPATSFARAATLLQKAAEQGARVVALPEMFATGFSMRSDEMAEHAATIRTFLAGTASAYGIWLLGGYAEPGDTRPANACGIFSPDGDEVLHYHKIHPFSLAREPEHYEPGEALASIEIEGVRVTPLICYDLRFPELFRAAAEATDLFVVIANWPTRRAEAWRTLLAARAMDCQAWVLGVNRVGEAEGYPHRGDTSLLDPWGAVSATLADEPGVVIGDLDAEVVRQARAHFPFLRDRRPELYRRLDASGVKKVKGEEVKR